MHAFKDPFSHAYQRSFLVKSWNISSEGWMTASMWKYIMLPHLVVLIEYSTQVSEVFQNFITFPLQIHAKTKFKTSKNFKRWLRLLSFKTQDRIPTTRYKVSHIFLVQRGLCYPYLGGMGDTGLFDHHHPPPPYTDTHTNTHKHTHAYTPEM